MFEHASVSDGVGSENTLV